MNYVNNGQIKTQSTNFVVFNSNKFLKYSKGLEVSSIVCKKIKLT